MKIGSTKEFGVPVLASSLRFMEDLERAQQMIARSFGIPSQLLRKDEAMPRNDAPPSKPDPPPIEVVRQDATKIRPRDGPRFRCSECGDPLDTAALLSPSPGVEFHACPKCGTRHATRSAHAQLIVPRPGSPCKIGGNTDDVTYTCGACDYRWQTEVEENPSRCPKCEAEFEVSVRKFTELEVREVSVVADWLKIETGGQVNLQTFEVDGVERTALRAFTLHWSLDDMMRLETEEMIR